MYFTFATDDKQAFADTIIAVAEKDGSAQVSITCDKSNYRAEIATGCEEPSSSSV